MQLSDLDVNAVYSYADYLKWQFEERVELIRGKVFQMSPAPNYAHQNLASRLHGYLWSHLKDRTCKVFFAPFDVRFPGKSKKDEDIVTVLQPDLCVICDLSKLDERGCNGAPDLVIEILSPSNNKRDLKYKYGVYEECGVKEYWIVYPSEQTITIHTLTEGRYVASRPLTTDDTIQSVVLPGLDLKLDDIFEQ